MDKHQTNAIIALFLISVAIIFFTFHVKKQPPGDLSTPPPVPVVEAAQPMVVESPDGKMTLTATRLTKDKEGLTYTFLMTDRVGGVQKQIFTRTEAVGTTLTIPGNTFSPDNKYVFLKEASQSAVSYLVFTNAQTLDVSSLFAAKYQDYVITDATGWAGPTLLILNTDKTGGGVGPTFWFDVASGSFVQLSTRFY